jgi:hypothetical protein
LRVFVDLIDYLEELNSFDRHFTILLEGNQREIGKGSEEKSRFFGD